MALAKADEEYEKYRIYQNRDYLSDFDLALVKYLQGVDKLVKINMMKQTWDLDDILKGETSIHSVGEKPRLRPSIGSQKGAAVFSRNSHRVKRGGIVRRLFIGAKCERLEGQRNGREMRSVICGIFKGTRLTG